MRWLLQKAGKQRAVALVNSKLFPAYQGVRCYGGLGPLVRLLIILIVGLSDSFLLEFVQGIIKEADILKSHVFKEEGISQYSFGDMRSAHQPRPYFMIS